MVTKMKKHAQASFKTRPKRKLPEDLCTPEDMSKWEVKASYTAHKTASPLVKAVAYRADQPDLVLSGGSDGQVLLYNVEEHKVQRNFTGHKKAVNSLIYHPTRDVVISGSDDKTVRMWVDSMFSYEFSCIDERPTVFKHHTGEVKGLSLQPCGDYFVSCATDNTWSFYDIASTRVIQSFDAGLESTCLVGSLYVDGILNAIQFHPDGLIMATGVSNGVIQVWDMKTQSVVTNFSEHQEAIQSIAFSENGYYMASAAVDGMVKLWDLRNGSCLQNVEIGSSVNSIVFDYSGSYLAAGASDLTVFNTKTWEKVYHNEEDVNGYYGLTFGPSAQYLLAGCGNRAVVKLSQ